MSPRIITFVGYLAGTLTTVSFLPQIIKTWSSKSSRDISFGWIFAFAAGICCWLAYGIYLRMAPIVVPNAVTLALILLLLGLKIYYK